MKQLEEYTLDELIALLKRISVYATIWWFKYYRMYKMKDEDKDKPIIDHYGRGWYLGASYKVLAYIKTEWKSNERTAEIYQQLLRNNVIDNQIHKLEEAGAEKNRSEIRKLECEKTAYLCVHNSLWWFGGGFEDYSNRLYDSFIQQEGLDAWLSPEEMEEQLHSNDEYHIENGVATDIQVYQFVWDTLQYLDIKQLGKLIKFTDTGIEKKWQNITIGAGRRDKVAEIQQIDIETGNVVATYMMRKDIIAKTGITKSHLAQCIKTAKDNPSNRNEWKKWKGSDGKLYGFTESQ
jgi:hypothetical protein